MRSNVSATNEVTLQSNACEKGNSPRTDKREKRVFRLKAASYQASFHCFTRFTEHHYPPYIIGVQSGKHVDDLCFFLVPLPSTSNWLLSRLEVARSRDMSLARQGSPPSYHMGIVCFALRKARKYLLANSPRVLRANGMTRATTFNIIHLHVTSGLRLH